MCVVCSCIFVGFSVCTCGCVHVGLVCMCVVCSCICVGFSVCTCGV